MMTTKFDSFDESAVGGFVESSLGARNFLEKFLDMVIFIDETFDTYFPSAANVQQARDDLARWNTALETYPTLKLQVAHVGGHEAFYNIWPDVDFYEIEWPRQVDYVEVERPPSVFDMDKLYREIIRTQRNNLVEPHGFRFIVDTSGSMDRSTIQPMYSALIERLRAASDETIMDNNYAGENWLGLAVARLVPGG